ncbi:MAG: BrnA antitoxin family protein [Methylococcaceae bacterium]|nr:BrnA antitoxin family protein [Methylococcaceae bacterium]
MRRPGQRGKQKIPVKVPTTIRFDADVLAALKSTGKGWQTRVNDAMREWLKTHQ